MDVRVSDKTKKNGLVNFLKVVCMILGLMGLRDFIELLEVTNSISQISGVTIIPAAGRREVSKHYFLVSWDFSKNLGQYAGKAEDAADQRGKGTSQSRHLATAQSPFGAD